MKKTIHNALIISWPSVKISGCRLHLHQAWFRKIQPLGLVSEFKNNNSKVGQWIKHTFGLTFLNPSEVEDCFVFDLLLSYKPKKSLLDQYADY